MILRRPDPIRVVIGKSWSRYFVWHNPDRSPVDLSGMTLSPVIRSVFADGRYAEQVPALVRQDVPGSMVLELSAEETRFLAPGCRNDVVVSCTDAAGVVHHLCQPVDGVSS